MVQILQVKYVEGLRSFQRESIFCSKISSGGSSFIKKLVPGGTNLCVWGGGHFNHDRTLLASNPGFPFRILSRSRFSSKLRDKIRNVWVGKAKWLLKNTIMHFAFIKKVNISQMQTLSSLEMIAQDYGWK